MGHEAQVSPFACACIRVTDYEYDYSFHGPTSLSFLTPYDVEVIAIAMEV